MGMEEEERECRMHALHRVYQPATGQGNLKACVALHYLPTTGAGLKLTRYGLHASLVLVPLQDVR